jgi:hypothetical protein
MVELGSPLAFQYFASRAAVVVPACFKRALCGGRVRFNITRRLAPAPRLGDMRGSADIFVGTPRSEASPLRGANLF